MDEKTEEEVNAKGKRSGMKIRIALALAVSLILLVLLALFFSKLLKRDVQSSSVLGYTMKSGELTSRMRINLLKAVELEKSAFMAITDEESKTFADQSLMTADAVERDYQELKGLIDKEGTGEEVKLLKEFGDCWKNFREIDRELLQLSVENTNIKAATLSYTGGAETIGRFERAFAQLMEIRSVCRIGGSHHKARLSGGYRRTYDLQSPSPAHQ